MSHGPPARWSGTTSGLPRQGRRPHGLARLTKWARSGPEVGPHWHTSAHLWAHSVSVHLRFTSTHFGDIPRHNGRAGGGRAGVAERSVTERPVAEWAVAERAVAEQAVLIPYIWSREWQQHPMAEWAVIEWGVKGSLYKTSLSPLCMQPCYSPATLLPLSLQQEFLSGICMQPPPLPLGAPPHP